MDVNGVAISSISRDVYGELFKMMTGVDMLHVLYRGGAPALTDLLVRQVQIMFDTLITSIEHIRTGNLRALAVTAATRVEVLPDIPTVGDFVPGYEAVGWQGVGAPGPRPSRLSISSTKRPMPVSPIPASKARIADYGYAAFASSPADFGRFIAAYTEKWARVIKFSGAKIY
jgi:tripartite-type tricarboxylate transporter receptor subunit TctC